MRWRAQDMSTTTTTTTSTMTSEPQHDQDDDAAASSPQPLSSSSSYHEDDDDDEQDLSSEMISRETVIDDDDDDDEDDDVDAIPKPLQVQEQHIQEDEGLDHSQPPPDDVGDESSPPWKPQTTQSTCEFTHTITNYSQKRESGCKKAEYSSTTVDEFGNRWRLIVYVNGNGRASNHHLSLFLQVADADDLPFGWKKAVSYVLTLEHPSGASLSYAKRNPDKTFKLCPKAIDWGWSQFITSDRIQQEGFVADDSLVVRASVTVKSSSVSIDLEDAELYLKCAVEEGNAEAVKLCLAQGAGVNCKFKDDLYTPLHTACSASPTNNSNNNNPDNASTNNNNNNANSPNNNSGSMEVLELLLERGADGNACNKWRETPLLIAANNGHRSAVEALLKHGADPSLCSEAGWSALTFAAHKGYEDIVALLLRAGAPVNCRVTEDSSTPLHKACAGSKPGHLSAVKQLIDGGADVHALNKWRETPLLTAANHGQAGAVEALLRAGADPCKCTDTGWSPLSIAAYKGHDDVVKLLLEEGAPTEEADPTLSALLQAATKGLPGTVELLLRHGADHTVTTKKGDTALSILVEQNLIDAAVEMVTEYKASVPRCSRDRKKVQRARLLINLRVKQQQREGLLNVSTDDDDETDQEDSSDEAPRSAQHHEEGDEGSPNHAANSKSTSATPDASHKANNKKKKKGGKKMSAEEQARAAEEALLLELEQEDAKAQKEQQEANKKSAKKRKKKERERQQKMKEEQERREREEREQKERQQRQKEKEEQQRKEREKRQKEQRERELKEAAEREKIAAAKRKEKEAREKRQRELQSQQEKHNRHKLQTASAPANTGNNTKNTVGATPPSTSTLADKRGRQARTKANNKKQQQQQQQPPSQPTTSSSFAPPSRNNEISRSSSAPVVHIAGNRPKVAPAPAPTPSSARGVAPSKKRGWETKPQPQVVTETRQTPPTSGNNNIVESFHYGSPKGKHQATAPAPVQAQAPTPPSGYSTPRRNEAIGSNGGSSTAEYVGFGASRQNKSSDSPFRSGPVADQSGGVTPTHGGRNGEYSAGELMNGVTTNYTVASIVEVPAVALFRQEKVSELLHRCAMARSQPNGSSFDALGVVDEETVKATLYRWMVRAAHEQSARLDCIIPSWIDFEQLTAFFQRQFIAESRKGVNQSVPGAGMVSMESLKAAGSELAILCYRIAKDVADFKARMEEQLPRDWSDATMGTSASDIPRNGMDSLILIDWANRSQVYLPASTYTKLRDRYVGAPNRLLTSLFVTKTRYDTQRLITSRTSMDYRLPPDTQAILSMEAAVSAELWSDPFSVLSSNIFWGKFSDVDGVFGGMEPFSKDSSNGDDILSRHGGSVCVFPPVDSILASRYMHRILDLLESSEADRIPLSFAVFLRSECFRDHVDVPTADDLHMLDPRFNDRRRSFLGRAEILPPGQHSYHTGEGVGMPEISRSGSLFVILQNEAGRSRFNIRDSSLSKIVQSMGATFQSANNDMHVVTSMPYSGDLMGSKDSMNQSHGGYFHGTQPLSPIAHGLNDFGAIGGDAITTAFTPSGSAVPSNNSQRRPGGRRGRLFDLVDDGEEDPTLNDVDVVSGMLNNLNVELFQNNVAQDVDIEAISLMGIGSLPPGNLHAPSSRSTSRFG